MTTEERREYDRSWYHKNKDRIRESKKINEKNYVKKKVAIVDEYLKTHPCIDCGEADIVVLDFDHINPATKKDNVSNLIYSGSIKTVLEEIEKCEIRCANCHRRKTARQFYTCRYKNVL
jgi:5-methylcytosine-specific restriction endonuclease McrA